MKKLIVVAALLMVALVSNSQSCDPPECSQSFDLGSSYSTNYINNFNNTAQGVVCFNGTSSINRIPTTFNVNNIQTFVFNPSDSRYDVQQTINMNGNKKIYVLPESNVTIAALSMNGGDTIFVGGILNIQSVQNVNNSIPTKQAVILLQGTGSVRINGQLYSAGSFYQAAGNTTNRIHILQGCLIGLPVKFGEIKVKLTYE